MANEDIVLRIKPIMDTGDVKSAVTQMEGFFSKMKLTPNMKGEVNQIFKDMAREADIFAEKSKGAFKTASDVKSFEQSGKRIEGLFQQISNIMTKLSGEDVSKLFNIDTSKIQTAQGELAKLEEKIKQVGSSSFTNLTNAINELNNVSKSKSIDAFFSAFKTGDLDSAGAQLKNLISNIQAFGGATEGTKKIVQDMLSNLAAGKINEVSNGFQKLQSEMGSGASTMKTYVTALQTVVQNMNSLSNNTGFVQATRDAELLKKEIDSMHTEQLRQIAQIMLQASGAIKDCGDSFSSYNSKVQQGAASTRSLGQEIDSLKNRATYFLSLTNSVNLFKRGIREAIETVKSLDAAMTETAVVTDFNIGDMWDKLPQYTKMANELGVATQGVYEASTLYYQQGLETEQVMALTNETLKMARIAGLDCADATDLMTAALRGFNMEINETSAQRVNDVYSELAAITAADTNEIATAMTKTASIANNANMELETTAALLAQMIETTREPAETAGTAMKTIVARFTEMKKSASEVFEVDGEEVNVNKVEEALRSAGVALRDTKGEFRDLDDVFLELSSKWNSLDNMTQRYIATTAAGSRQQSRFIAMMQDYERTMELVEAAYGSAGASSEQFSKTQESLESKLARLKNAWNTFLMGIADDKIVKGFVDALTGLMNGFNKLTENLDGIGGSAVRIIAVFAGFRGVRAIIEKLVKSFAVLKGEAQGLTILQSLTQRINNFKLGKGFVVNADVDTKGANAKIAALRTNWRSFKTAVAEPITPTGTIVGFEVLNGKMVATGVTAEGATESIELGLSEVGTQAILASEACEEVGEDLVKSGLQGKAALDALQAEYMETIALAEALDRANDGEMVEFTGKRIQGKFMASEGSRQYWKGRGQTLGTDMTSVQTAMGKAGTSATGTWASGFKAMLTSLKPILLVLGKVLAVLGAIAAITAIIYNKSPFKKAKNEAEAAAGSVDDYNRALEKNKEETEALSGLLNELKGRADTFDTLIQGSAEWYQAIADSNAELLKQIELLNSLGYDVGYSYDENGMIQVDDEAELRTAQTKAAQKQIELQKGQAAASQGSDVASLKKGYLEENTNAQNKAFGKTLGTGLAHTAGTVAATEAIGSGASIAALATGNPLGLVGWVVTQATAITEAVAGTVTSVVKAFQSGKEAIDEYAHEGAYAELTAGQKTALDNRSQEAAATTWGIYAEDETQKKAGLKVIENMDNAYEQFYSNEAFAKQFDDKFKIADFGNSELNYSDGKDITEGNLDQVIKDLGYADWNEAAASLGLKWDKEVGGAEGLYSLDEKGEKQYFDVSNHGGVDTEEEWASLMSDPDGGAHVGDSKNIDAGYLALKLAKNKSGSNIAEMISSALSGEVAEQVLYGTENWGDHAWDGGIDENSTEMEKAVAKATLEANRKRRQIFNSLYDSTLEDGSKVFGEQERDYMEELSGNIQRLSVDTNETTARAYQAFVTQQQGLVTRQKQLGEGGNVDLLNRPEIDASKLAKTGWEDAGEGTATVFTNTFSNEEGNLAMNFTPILPNGEVLTPEELTQYAESVLRGEIDDSDVETGGLNLKIGATFEGEDAIQQAEAAAEEIHQLQEAYYSTDFSKDKADEYYELFSKLDLEDATASLETLNEEIAKGSEEAKILKENLTAKGSSLDISNQFSDLIKSGVLDEISEEISKLSDEAGNIDVTATRELVDGNKELKNIMDEFNVSGYAMGKILTDIQNGELTLTEINNGLIESYKLLYSAMGQAEDVLYDLRNADLGEDYTEIGRTYGERYATAKDLYKRKAYGSENFAGNIKSLIGEEEWRKYVEKSEGSNKKAYEAVVEKYHLDQNKGNLYGSFSQLISEAGEKNQIFKNVDGTITYDFSIEGIDTYDDVIQHMVDVFGISREYAKAMLADMATYSDTLQNDLNNLNAAANANAVYNAMYHEKENVWNKALGKYEEIEKHYTNLSDEDIVSTFSKTQQWEDSKKILSQGKGWDTKTPEEQTKAITNLFKALNGIKNTVTVKENGKETERKIESVDSQGNKYYKDDKGETQVQRTSSKQLKRIKTEHYGMTTNGDPDGNDEAYGLISTEYETDADYGKRLSEDQNVREMAVELEDEEFQAWLDSYTGEDNSYNVLLEAGFSQDSLAGVEMMKNEMIAKIQGVADALKAMTIKIPITVPMGLIDASLTGDAAMAPSEEFFITIGGANTGVSYTGGKSGEAAVKKAIADYNKFTNLKNNTTGSGYQGGHDEDNDPDDGGSKGKNDTDAKDENLRRKLDAYKRKLDNGEISVMEYSQKKRKTLQERQLHLEEKKNNQLKENKYDKQIYDYSDELDDFIIKAEEYNKLSDKEKNLVDEELQKLREINDELNEIEDQLGNMSPEQMAREQEKNQSQAALDNYEKDLETIEDERHDLSIAQEIAGKGPSEVQDLFNMGFAVEGMLLEGEEVSTRLGMRTEYGETMDAIIGDLTVPEQNDYNRSYIGEKGDPSKPFYLDPETGALKKNEDFYGSTEYAGWEKEEKDFLQQQYDTYDEVYQLNRENERELSGGKLQKNLLDMADATNTFGKELQKGSEASGKTTRATKAMEKAIDSLDIDDRLKDPLKQLGSAFGKAIDSTEILEKDFSGLGKTLDKIPVSDGLKKLVSTTLGKDAADKMGSGGMGSAIGSLVGEGGALSGMPGADMIGKLIGGGKIGEIVGAAVSGTIGGPAGALLSLASGDMMSMGMDFMNAGMGMAGQMKDMASQMIQYVVQFVTTVINWWINREDQLYNLLSAIEQEVHNFNRQEQVEERFRLYSDEGLNDLVSAWEAMRVSLERQIDLNEQLIKSRQAELQFLNLTNLPFSPAFYYDYTEERVIENPWVYDIYVLLLDLGAMLPEIGQIFSSIKQLMEDNKKRMEDGVKEIEDAREEILELEKKQLELRTQYMEDEIELEELVMDSIIEKQQEEIDELSAMNDAITEANEKLINTLNSNLDKIREQRDNEEKEEELGEKERRLTYLRQDTSNANRLEIKKLQEELEDERRDYTDELIDQKISALEEQNEKAAEQRQKQIDLLQGQLDYTEKYGLQWEEAQRLIKNGFDSEGRLRVGSDLFDMLMSKEDFTSMGNGSTRQTQQIMDWNVTSIAAAAFREINDIWEEGFGNFKMSNDVHDQSRLHLWDDREVDYYELPSWLSFLQPAVNTIQDYLWRTGNNIETFIDTSFLSGKESTSILGKTIVPLLQEMVALLKGEINEYNKTSEADGTTVYLDPGQIALDDQTTYDLGERIVNGMADALFSFGQSMIRAFTGTKSNSQTTYNSTESYSTNIENVYLNSDGEQGAFVEYLINGTRQGNSSNLVGS